MITAPRQFISYPKSGRSWIRYALTLLDIEKHICFHHDGFEFNDGTKPPHNFDVEERLAIYSQADRIVYLSRDPRDVMVSLFFQVTGRFKDFFHYKGNISDFIRDKYFGAHNLKAFQDMWAELSDKTNTLHVTYELCHEDLPGVLGQIVMHYGFAVPTERLIEVAGQSQFDLMKAVESKGQFKYPWLRPRNDSIKVRRGMISGFVDTLSIDDIDYLNKMFGLA
jgi:hypothetical protein